MRLLTLPFRAVWALVASALRLLGFGTGVKPGCWQPPRDSNHPLWQTVEAHRQMLVSAPGCAPETGRRKRRPVGRLVIVGAATALIVAAGSLAYFAATGSGSGSAVAGTAQPVTFSEGTTTSQLYPGGSADVALSVSNPNAFSVRISSIVLDPSQGDSGFTAVGCTPAEAALSFSSTPLDNGGSGWDVPAHATHLDIDLANAVSMAATASNSCQSAQFTVYLRAGS